MFRVYQQVPEHYHKQCDEVLIVIAGELEFKTDGEPAKVLSKDQLVIFRKNTIHSIKPGGDNPVYFLSIDTPRREASDIYFIDPAHNGLKFITHIGER